MQVYTWKLWTKLTSDRFPPLIFSPTARIFQNSKQNFRKFLYSCKREAEYRIIVNFLLFCCIILPTFCLYQFIFEAFVRQFNSWYQSSKQVSFILLFQITRIWELEFVRCLLLWRVRYSYFNNNRLTRNSFPNQTNVNFCLKFITWW